ncbi:hypothetical protein LXM94_18000 [Rhizobium sp. TRM95111]|uniref:hypothetical protein n=1 Tax=Rhizobium alarense TaxID=2846851 RepID=UPI001F40FA1B|nr:hypothetical protein [Rhizobium alarense]MCF3641867.1 hypothetical protein [Rhizobium alarense]
MPAAALFPAVAICLSRVTALAWRAVVRGAKSGRVDAVWSFLVGAAGVAAAPSR